MQIFVSRVGGIILALMIVLWFLASYPAPPPDATGPAIQYSFAGTIGALLAAHLCAARVQLADLDRARARTRGARSRRRRARHGVRDVRRRVMTLPRSSSP